MKCRISRHANNALTGRLPLEADLIRKGVRAFILGFLSAMNLNKVPCLREEADVWTLVSRSQKEMERETGLIGTANGERAGGAPFLLCLKSAAAKWCEQITSSHFLLLITSFRLACDSIAIHASHTGLLVVLLGNLWNDKEELMEESFGQTG